MAITSSSVNSTDTLETFRQEFNNAVVDLGNIEGANTFTSSIVFEGSTDDSNETTLTVTDPTADRTITLPNLTGTVSLITATETLTNKTLTTPVIAEIDSGSTITLDATTDIVLDADGGDIFFKDAGTTFGSATNTSGNLIIKSGTTTALTFSGANLTAAGTIDSGAITSTGVITGTGFTIGSAAILEAELEILDGANVTTAELNLLDGSAKSTSSITLADADAFIVIDGTTTKQIPASDIKTYAGGAVTAINNATANELVTIGSTTTELDAEANLTFDGSTFAVTGDATISDDLGLVSDAAVLTFGANSEITVTHVHNTGLNFKHTATGDDKPIILTLQTGETDIATDDVLGTINFQAPDEGTGTDAILVAAGIEAISETDFSSSSNATSLIFKTASSEAAAEKVRIDSSGRVNIGAISSTSVSGYGLKLESSGNVQYLLKAAANFNSTISFGDPDSNTVGQIIYAHNGDHLRFEVNGDESMRIDSSERIQINGTNGTEFLNVVGAVGCSGGSSNFSAGPARTLLDFTGSLGRVATVNGASGSATPLTFLTANTERMRIEASAAIFHINESANGDMTTGLTINQGAADNSAFTLKSSDVAHGMTTEHETDTYAQFSKVSGTEGGLNIKGLAEGGEALLLSAAATDSDTSDTSSSRAPIEVRPSKKDSTSIGDFGSSDNLILFFNNNTRRMLLKGSGALHLSNTTLVALDTEDDAMLVRQLDKATSSAGVIDTQWDQFVNKNNDKLKEIGVLSSEEDFIVVQPHLKLLNGATWQQRVMFETMKKVADEMLPGFADKLNEKLAEQNLPALPISA